MKKISDGWHKVSGYDVYIEDGKILRGIKLDHNGSQVTAYPYVKYNGPGGGWTSCSGITVEAFRSRVKRGTAMMS